ncbi:hypothetical protein, partial [Moorena sp. SIO4E2]|uniref:hypothetical protein n=1 Tax=Moorena sp. SIO4E2 TaxID=2607826 RepID=UPI00257E4482
MPIPLLGTAHPTINDCIQSPLESMPGITQGTSPSNLGVRLSPHPAPRYPDLSVCFRGLVDGSCDELLANSLVSSYRGFHQYDVSVRLLPL